MKALIIEDLPSDLVLIQETLKCLKGNLRFPAKNTDNAGSAAAAFKLLNNNEYDLIFLDLNLPDSSGTETVEKIVDAKQLSVLNTCTPIIVLTGVGDAAIAKQALGIGARDYLVKGEYGCKDLERAVTFATYSKNNPKRSKWSKKLFKRF